MKGGGLQECGAVDKQSVETASKNVYALFLELNDIAETGFNSGETGSWFRFGRFPAGSTCTWAL